MTSSITSYIAGLTDIAWRRRAGAERPAWAEREPIPPEDAPTVDRVLNLLDELSPLWHGLPVGGSLTFTWPHTTARVQAAHR